MSHNLHIEICEKQLKESETKLKEKKKMKEEKSMEQEKNQERVL